jgi:hypothetical protein
MADDFTWTGVLSGKGCPTRVSLKVDGIAPELRHGVPNTDHLERRPALLSAGGVAKEGVPRRQLG